MALRTQVRRKIVGGARSLYQVTDQHAARPRADQYRVRGNRAMVAGHDHQTPRLSVVRHEHVNEQRARQVADNAARTPPRESFGVPASHTRLSTCARQYFEEIVGAPLARARLHTGAAPDELNRLSHARATTIGDDVFLPHRHTDANSPRERALLAHELAHVGQASRTGDPLLYRDAPSPHYPTEAEQRHIEQLLQRVYAPPTPTPEARPEAAEQAEQAEEESAEATPPEPVVDRGRSLSNEEREQLAQRLMVAFFHTLDTEYLNVAPSTAPAVSDEHVLNTVEAALRALQRKFGRYFHRQVSITTDEGLSRAERRANNQILLNVTDMGDMGRAIANVIIVTNCEECLAALRNLDDDSRDSVVRRMLATAEKDRAADLRRAALARVNGTFSQSDDILRLPPRPRAIQFGTSVHELVHALAHPAFTAAFDNERNIVEGFTEYFTRQLLADHGSYPEEYHAVNTISELNAPPFLFGVGVTTSIEESLRQAYFRGRLDLIGWRPSGPAEQAAVEDAGGSAPWNPRTARAREQAQRARLQELQGNNRNIFGVGVGFFRSGNDPVFSIRYTRVLFATDPFARFRLTGDGEILSAPVQDPQRLGASIGLGAEYQHPYFFANAGVRFRAEGALGVSDNRIDISPYVGAGIRAWHSLRVGAEGFVLVPLTEGDPTLPGIGGTIALEF